MSKVVYKYPMVRMVNVSVPIGKVVMAGPDATNTLCVWVEHDTEEDRRMTLRVFGTGAIIPEHCYHAASFADLPYIWHVYRVLDTTLDYSRNP